MMPLLIYCVNQSTASTIAACTGVDGNAVGAVEREGLRCYVSRTEGDDSALVTPVREAALAFHRVVKNIFDQSAIIPFRFPTVFSAESEVIVHLEECSAEYHATLERLRDKVQMEIRLRMNDSKLTVQSGASLEQLSGTEYLRKAQRRQSQMENAARQFRESGSKWTSAWKQRHSTDGLQCFALIERGAILEFENELKILPIPENMTARLSGPWPATQFLNAEP